MGRFLIETHLRTRRPIKKLAAAHEVNARWLFKLLRRYRLEGPAGLEPRSRRPHRSPTRIADVYENEIVALHKQLADDELDAGAATIHFHLAQRYSRPPSVSTVFRVLKVRGFVTLSPQKRPKSSFTRFVANLPNECWQADMTHVEFGGGHLYEVLNMIDDHSRLCVASRARICLSPSPVVLHHISTSDGHRRTRSRRPVDPSSQPCRLKPVLASCCQVLGARGVPGSCYQHPSIQGRSPNQRVATPPPTSSDCGLRHPPHYWSQVGYPSDGAFIHERRMAGAPHRLRPLTMGGSPVHRPYHVQRFSPSRRSSDGPGQWMAPELG